MKRLALACLLVTVFTAPSFAQSEIKRLVRLDGWIVDSWCGTKNANTESTEDTLACVKKGAKLILVTSDGTSYALADQERALQYVGQEIKLFGMVDKDRNLTVGNYIGIDKTDPTKGSKPEKAVNLLLRRTGSTKRAQPGESDAESKSSAAPKPTESSEPAKKDD